MPKFCDTCSWWEFTYPDGTKRFGICGNIMASELVRVSQDENSIDEQTVFTEANFGCLYHEEEEKAIVKIEPD